MVESRNIAQTVIKEGRVTLDGVIVQKPSMDVKEGSKVVLLETKIYVGRAAHKLKNFLIEHPVKVENRVVLDIGASTGGFTEVLLEEGAKQVFALDVGSDQLHHSLKADHRVVSIEQQDVRTFEHAPFELVTCDVSFISLHQILDAINRLASSDIILLFKPQFEVGKTVKRTKAGVVTDRDAIELAKRRFEDACSLLGWQVIKSVDSKVEGKEGNREIFFHYSK